MLMLSKFVTQGCTYKDIIVEENGKYILAHVLVFQSPIIKVLKRTIFGFAY